MQQCNHTSCNNAMICDDVRSYVMLMNDVEHIILQVSNAFDMSTLRYVYLV